MANINFVNHVVAVGSVDGVCTAAAVLRLTGNPAAIGLEFCQAFTVDKVNPVAWESGRQVIFVDLAVNNRDKSMAVDFLRRVKAAGHAIIGVLDEHNADDWRKAFADAELSFDELAIKPVSQGEGDIKSSGALLLFLLGDEADEQTRELCDAGDAGDRMDFSTHFGGLVNQAVKSAIADDSRRVYLARHFAANREPDSKVLGWIREYEVILANHDKIVDGLEDLGDGIHRVTATGMAIDMTTLMSRLYKAGARVVALEGEVFNKSLGRKTVQVSFGTSDKSLDLLVAIKAAVPSASGFTQKVNVDPEDEAAAIQSIRNAVK